MNTTIQKDMTTNFPRQFACEEVVFLRETALWPTRTPVFHSCTMQINAQLSWVKEIHLNRDYHYSAGSLGSLGSRCPPPLPPPPRFPPLCPPLCPLSPVPCASPPPVDARASEPPIVSVAVASR